MEKTEIINLRKLIASKNARLLKWIPRFILNYLERIIHQEDVNSFLAKNNTLNEYDFSEAVVKHIGITYSVKGLEKLDEHERFICVMNHPLGGLDAIVLVAALKEKKLPLKFIVNDLLLHLEALKSIFIGINKHGKTAAQQLIAINKVFADEKCICIFPAGLVSRKIDGKVQDLEWRKTVISQAKKNGLPIIPIRISGELSPFFYRLSAWRKRLGLKVNLEMLYLVDEMFAQKGKHIQFTVGNAIEATYFDKTKSDVQWAEWLRQHVHSIEIEK